MKLWGLQLFLCYLGHHIIQTHLDGSFLLSLATPNSTSTLFSKHPNLVLNFIHHEKSSTMLQLFSDLKHSHGLYIMFSTMEEIHFSSTKIPLN